MNNKRPEFIEHFLIRRLKRVPIAVLSDFVLKLNDSTLENKARKKSQQQLVDEIVFYYKLMREKADFILTFTDFIRDHLFSAKESEYLIQIPDPEKVINWVKSWTNDKYIGQRYDFSMHTYIQLQEKFLLLDEQSISFPYKIILLVASSQTPKSIPSGLELFNYFPTTEIELVFRKNMNLMEIRGQFEVIRDFVNTAVIDSHNPLAMAHSLFIGDREDAKYNSIVKPISKIIQIDALKKALNGKYLTISAPVKGSKTSRIKASLEELDDLTEETHPQIQPILENLLKDQDKSRISFRYDKSKFSFGITKSGGLTFMQYAPEEVVTYVVSKINSL